MHAFVLLILCFGFLVFLLMMFVLSRDDLTLLRRNVSIEHVFNVSFLIGVTAFVMSRLFFVISTLDRYLFNPFAFFLIPRYPGLSLTGAVVGGIVALLFARRFDLPALRLFDHSSVAALAAFCTGFTLLIPFRLLARVGASPLLLLQTAISFLLLLFFALFLLPLARRGGMHEGSMGLFFLLFFSCLTFVEHTLTRPSRLFFFTGFEDIVVLVLFLSSLGLLMKQERLIPFL